MGLFSIFLYTLIINCVTTGARKTPIEYMFCFIRSEHCIKNHFVAQEMWLFKKIIPNNTTPTYHEVDGVILPLTFCRWHKNSHGIALNIKS